MKCRNCGLEVNASFEHLYPVRGGWAYHCPESSPTQVRSNDLIGEREHVSEREAVPEGDQGEKREATTRAIGAESEQLLMPCRADDFACYLIDNFEGAEITEEFIRQALSDFAKAGQP